MLDLSTFNLDQYIAYICKLFHWEYSIKSLNFSVLGASCDFDNFLKSYGGQIDLTFIETYIPLGNNNIVRNTVTLHFDKANNIVTVSNNSFGFKVYALLAYKTTQVTHQDYSHSKNAIELLTKTLLKSYFYAIHKIDPNTAKSMQIDNLRHYPYFLSLFTYNYETYLKDIKFKEVLRVPSKTGNALFFDNEVIWFVGKPYLVKVETSVGAFAQPQKITAYLYTTTLVTDMDLHNMCQDTELKCHILTTGKYGQVIEVDVKDGELLQLLSIFRNLETPSLWDINALGFSFNSTAEENVDYNLRMLKTADPDLIFMLQNYIEYNKKR